LIAARPVFQISNDRELKEIDLQSWDCLKRLEGNAKTPDGVERNRLKNRSAPDVAPPMVDLDTTGFLQRSADFEVQTKGKHRKDLSPAQQQQLAALEKQAVALSGYLVLAYCGPTESTNCGSVDFHDWHLEIFEQPLDHAPRPGDATPIICEITPRTQNAIYRDKIRIQELAGFFRRADFDYEPTGHPARRVRVTGYLLWDDDHNGAADVGTTIHTVGANKYHNPWRSAAWEIHPVFKVEPLDNVPMAPAVSASPVQASPSPSTEIPPVPPPPSPVSSPATQQFVTIVQPVKIKIPYGETVLPRGGKFQIVSRHGQTVIIRYMNGAYAIPIGSIDLR
jgi:hypothetical protein